MKKGFSLFIFCAAVIFSCNYAYSQISEKELLKVAGSYAEYDPLFSGYKVNNKNSVKQVLNNKKETLAYVVSLKPEGFIILAPSKSLYPVVAYSENGKFDFSENEYNSLLAVLRTDLSCQLETLKAPKLSSAQEEIIKKNQEKWAELLSGNIQPAKEYLYYFGPNLKDTWGGVNCKDENGNFIYTGNYFTPNNYSPGCVATSMSQILNLFKWPPIGDGEHTDIDNVGSSQGSYYAGFGRMWYDWDNMLDEYYGVPSTDTERRAIGRIAYHCGVAVDMDYENTGSTSNITRTPAVLNNYFRSSGHYEPGSWFYFWPRLRSNIENGYAVQLAVRDVSSGAGHANVCDGWRQLTISDPKYYHLNNGWWGTCNAWYNLQNTFSDCGYDAIDAAVFDILPDPIMTDEPIRSETDYKTFTLQWRVSKSLNWEAFELQESVDNGAWTTISNTITDTFYTVTVPSDGLYKYQVRAKSSGSYYADSYSEECVVPVGKIVYLNFDGDDSFYVKDNPVNDLDISDKWTVEAWIEVDTRTSGTYPVILDRKTVFSMYLIDDVDGGGNYGIRFVARDASGNIIASVQSDASSDIFFGEWVHVAVTRDGNETKMFINGKVVDTSSDANFNLTATANALNIGARYWTTYERYLDGRIDEIRISDTARYSTDFCPDRYNRFITDKNTKLLLHIESGTGTKIKDYSYNFIKPTLRAATNDPGWASALCPIITSEPEDISVCQGSVFFAVTAANAGSYQWYEDSGSGYVPLSDGGVYSGTATDTLKISNISGLNGYKYRCKVGGNGLFSMHDCSREATLTVYAFCTTWDGTSWDNGEPDNTMSALIAGNYTLPYDIEAKNLTILHGDTVIVPPNLTLTANSYFENHGVIILESNTNNIPTGALLLYGIQNNFGKMKARRYISVPSPGIWGNWHLISLPFDDVFKADSILTGNYYLYKNIEPLYSWERLSGADNMLSGNGYLLQHTQNGGFLIDTEGIFGNGNYSRTLPLTTGTNLGWFLAANPYPSPIDWNAASGWTRTNINSTVYTFDPENNGGSNQYSSWDGTVGTYSGSRYINSFQGFFVQALSDGAVIGTDNNVRVKNSEATSNYLKAGKTEDLIRIEIEDPQGKKDELVVYAGSTVSESIKVYGLDKNAPSVFIFEDDGKYVIKRILNSKNTETINFCFTSPLTGIFKMNITELLNTNYNIYIRDTETDKIYEIKKPESLFFNINDTTNHNFELIFSKNSLSVNNFGNDIQIFSANNSIIISDNKSSHYNISIYDISGKEIFSGFNNKGTTVITNINNGFYIVKFKNKNNEFIKKIPVF